MLKMCYIRVEILCFFVQLIFQIEENMFTTTFLLGRPHSGTPFRDVFPILVALSLGAVLRLSNTLSTYIHNDGEALL